LWYDDDGEKAKFVDLAISLDNRAVLIDKFKQLFPGERGRTYKVMLCLLANLRVYEPRVCPRRKVWFTKLHSKWFTYTFAVRAQDLLADAEFITINKGFISEGYESGLATTLMRGPEFWNLFTTDAMPMVDPDELPDVEYLGSEFNLGLNVSTPAYRDLMSKPELKKRLLQMGEYNRFIQNVSVRLFDNNYSPTLNSYIPINAKLTSVFDEEKHQDIGLGRLFQKHFASYQQLPKNERSQILLNGHPVSEPDYKGCFWFILYGMNGIQPPLEDPYKPVMQALKV
jgi:hypothetical protein